MQVVAEKCINNNASRGEIPVHSILIICTASGLGSTGQPIRLIITNNDKIAAS